MNPQNLGSPGINYVGVRTAHINAMKQFAETVLGYQKTHDSGDFVAFTTPQGQRFEFHAEDTPDKQFYPLEGAVAGFEVVDFDAALAWLKTSGYEVFKEGIGGSRGSTQWVHFCGPDGNIYEFVHHPAATVSKELA